MNYEYKNNYGCNFQFTKFLFTDFFLTNRRNLSDTRAKLACGKASSCRFSSSAARNVITKATEYITFGFPFRILVFSAFKESLNVAVSDTDFSVFKQLQSEHDPTNNLGLRMVMALRFVHQPDRVARKASDVSSADWGYLIHVKNILFFHVCCLRLSSGLKILL